MSSDKKPPIIKKIIRKGHGGHHGGSWKVAYADFVTAMMAFFLVMWLLAISSEQGREALADYFNELTMAEAVFNGGLPTAFTEGGGAKRPGILEGGCFRPKSEGEATVDPEADNEAVQSQMVALLETSQQLLKNLESLPAGEEGGEGSGDAGRSDIPPGTPAGGDGGGGHLNPAQEEFKKELLAQVQGAMGDSASGQVEVEKIRGGVRIQIMDQDGRPLFGIGGAKFTKQGQELISAVAHRLAGTTNKISIEGHTDALTTTSQKVTNWELSMMRASAARILLNRAGVADNRLTAVTGYADTRPLPDTDPLEPQNRRISIMVWDEDAAPPPAATPATAPARPGVSPTAPPAGTRPEAASPPPADRTPAAAPPPLPRRPAARPPAPQKTREQVESELIESSMHRAATDRSTVGPPVPAKPEDEE
jgi:chemotaxis protein MotB